MRVRDAIFQLLAERKVGQLFGNPGSTELTLIAGISEHLRYVLCLHEAVAVGAATGYSLVSGRPGVVNLHTLPGLGNAMGAIATARANKAPVVITAGQQDSRHLRHEPLLSGPLAEVAAPLVKWSHQPVRAEDVPMALERAFRVAVTPPTGPTFLSLPMDFLEREAEPVVPADPVRAGGLRPATAAAVVEQLRAARSPALVTGAGVEAAGAWDDTVRLAEALSLAVYAAPLASQFGFPTGHQRFRGPLPFHAGRIRATLEEHDVVLVVGAPVFVRYPYSPEHVVPEGTSLVLITDDPDEAARLEGGTGYVVDLHDAVAELADHAGPAPVSVAPPADHAAPAPVAGSPPGDTTASTAGSPGPQPGAVGIDLASACAALARHRRDDGILVDESISSGGLVRRFLHVSAPRSYARSANGGLGFSLPAAIGAQLARPEAQVLAVVGDGAAMYAPQALWTLAQQHLPVTVVVLNNGGYKILRDFHARTSAHLGSVPGLSVPDLDLVGLAASLGVASSRAERADELDEVLAEAFAASGPHLVDIQLDTTAPNVFT